MNNVPIPGLLPCPFCGFTGIDFTHPSTFRWITAECQNCGATCGEVRVQTIGDGTRAQWLEDAEKKAISAWNARKYARVRR
jgi:Lar family restriction alleviation protein